MPVVLCFHGNGSTAAIFEMQTTKLRSAMPQDLEYVFFDAPTVGAAGPGVLPTFADAAPFYTWFGTAKANRATEVAALQQKVSHTIDTVQADRWPDLRSQDIVGVLAFSQGVIASTLLLLQQANGVITWFPNIRWMLSICGDHRKDLLEHVGDGEVQHKRLSLISLHVIGDADPYAARSRMMAATFFDQSTTGTLAFAGSHQPPSREDDCERIARSLAAALEGM